METLASTERWSPEKDEWCLCASLRTPRAGVRVATLRDRYLLAVGGNEDVFGSNINLNTVELYDVLQNSWSLLDNLLSKPRATAGVTAIDGQRVLVVGGSKDRAEVDSSAEVYYAVEPGQSCREKFLPLHDTKVPGLAEGRMGTQAAQLRLPRPGCIYPVSVQPCIAVVGGEHLGPLFPRQLASVPVFDLETLAWREDSIIPPMSVGRTAAAVCVSIGHTTGGCQSQR